MIAFSSKKIRNFLIFVVASIINNHVIDASDFAIIGGFVRRNSSPFRIFKKSSSVILHHQQAQKKEGFNYYETTIYTDNKYASTLENVNSNVASSSSAYRIINNIRGGGGGGGVMWSSSGVAEFLNAVDIFGTCVFSFSGALQAGKNGMDLLGMYIIATITAVGGGTVRDIVLDSGTVFWMENTIYVQITLVITLLTFYLWPLCEKKLGWKDTAIPICTSDAFGLAAFAVLGTQKAMTITPQKSMSSNDRLHPMVWIVSGLVSSIFGGIIRDTLCLQKPRVLYPERTLYATSPLLGSMTYTFLTLLFANSPEKEDVLSTQTISCISFLVTFITRVLCFNNPIRLPHWKKKKRSHRPGSGKKEEEEEDTPPPRID